VERRAAGTSRPRTTCSIEPCHHRRPHSFQFGLTSAQTIPRGCTAAWRDDRSRLRYLGRCASTRRVKDKGRAHEESHTVIWSGRWRGPHGWHRLLGHRNDHLVGRRSGGHASRPAGARANSLASFALRSLRGSGRRSSPLSASRSNAYRTASAACGDGGAHRTPRRRVGDPASPSMVKDLARSLAAAAAMAG
jgi:hypothetical protein